jgi:branched-chain amino acid transport system substrate-binding protein
VRIRIGSSLLAAILVTLLAVSAAQARSTAGKTITIDWIGDKSGPTVASQAPVLHGMEAYFRMVNDAGGINGDKINVIEKDDQFSPAKELELVKSAVNDDHASLITGIGNSSGFASVVPYLTSVHVPGLSSNGTLESNTNPFQPWMFQGNCNYADQGEVALGYEMTHLKLKTLKGVKVGIAAITNAGGQEWIQALSSRVTKLGGTPVAEQLPNPIVNADVQAQAFADAKVKFILVQHSIAGGIAMLKSLAKYGVDVPISSPYSLAQAIVYTSTPYSVAKNFTGVNCVSPPLYVKTAKGKLAYAMGKKYGYPDAEIVQQNFALGWVNGQMVVQGLRNAKGDYSGPGVKAGLEKVRNLDTGGLSPNLNLSPTCHMAIQTARPYNYIFSKDAMIPVGTYEQWHKFITNQQAAPGTCGKPK